LNDFVTTSTGSLIRSVAWNLIGDGSPILAAVFAIPVLIRDLGNERFGVLALAWTIVGYFGLFDVGLGRALTKLIAEKRVVGQSADIPGLIHAALLLLLSFGAVAGLLLAGLCPWLVGHILKIPAPLHRETLQACYLLAFSLPAGLCLSGLRGVLAAYLRFDLINSLRIPFTLFLFLGPLMVLPFSRSLAYIVALLVGARLISCALHLLFCFRLVPELYGPLRVRTTSIMPLLRFGGWITVSNIVNPLLVYADRFVIGALLSMEAVTWYVTPYEMVTKLVLIPGAIVVVLFPAFAESWPVAPARALLLFDRAAKYILIAMFPVILLVVTIAPQVLALWLGANFAAHGARVLQWLALGVFINSVAQLPFALIQAADRPDLTAKLHLIEVPVYLALLRWLIVIDGVEGAAIAWTLRMVADAAALFVISAQFFPSTAPTIRSIFGMFAMAAAGVVVGIWLPNGRASLLFLVLALLIFSAVTWSRLLSADEKSVLRSGPKAIWELP
jgi:O-antigen/teichoic acid export membrane protein